MATMSYIVTKPFVYAGKPFQRGDVWEPGGSRNDDAIIRARMVAEVKAMPAKKAATK